MTDSQQSSEVFQTTQLSRTISVVSKQPITSCNFKWPVKGFKRKTFGRVSKEVRNFVLGTEMINWLVENGGTFTLSGTPGMGPTKSRTVGVVDLESSRLLWTFDINSVVIKSFDLNKLYRSSGTRNPHPAYQFQFTLVDDKVGDKHFAKHARNSMDTTGISHVSTTTMREHLYAR